MKPHRTKIPLQFIALLMTFVLTACSDSNSDGDPMTGGDDAGQPRTSDTQQLSTEDALMVQQIFQTAADDGFTGVALVRFRGEILLHDATGLADRELEIPNTTDTVFDMGSITKQYTAALVLSLQEAGLLQVDDTLAQHLINVPEDKANITIHQLLTHTAGFPASIGFDEEAIDREDFLNRAFTTTLEFEPGSRYGYANVGYSIAAAIAETVSGQSYEELLNERLFAPAGMSETGYLLPDWSDRSIAIGYNDREASFESQSIWGVEGPYWNLNGNGGLLTTTSDMLKWHDALSGESVLSASSIEAISDRYIDLSTEPGSDIPPGEEFYGYGWEVRNSDLGTLLLHGGANGFHLAVFGRLLDEDLTIVILSNQQSEATIDFASDIFDSLVPGVDVP